MESYIFRLGLLISIKARERIPVPLGTGQPDLETPLRDFPSDLRLYQVHIYDFILPLSKFSMITHRVVSKIC